MPSSHTSRWKYWYAYLLIILLAGLWIWTRDTGKDALALFAGVFALSFFVIFEVIIRKERIVLSEDGIIRKKWTKELEKISYSDISDVSIRRVGLFDDIIIKTTSRELVLKSFSLPRKLQKSIAKRANREDWIKL